MFFIGDFIVFDFIWEFLWDICDDGGRDYAYEGFFMF